MEEHFLHVHSFFVLGNVSDITIACGICFKRLQALNSQSYLQSLHEGLGARLGDGTQVINQVGFGHANSSVNNGQGTIFFVWNNVNFHILGTIQLGGISQAFVTNLVQSL